MNEAMSSPSAAPPIDPALGPALLADRADEIEFHRAFGVEARLGRAREVERDAVAAGDEEIAMRARLVVGDMLHRIGATTAGAQLVVEVHAWAGAHRNRQVLARGHLVLSTIFESIGDPPSSLDHAVRAIDLIDDTISPRERGNYLLRLADSLAFSESADQARRRYGEAAALFRSIGDRERLLNMLNNITVLESEVGDATSARRTADQFAGAVEPSEMNSDYAETIARARLVGGDLDGALDATDTGLDLLATDGDSKATSRAELELTRAEILLQLGRRDDAQVSLDRCVAICAERHLAGMTTQAMGVQAQVFAARGDFERAYLTHREFHAASMRLRSHQHEAAARAREALFETTEARREAERFRMQARIDPLTELYNRRFVDETLPRWLSAGAGATITVAIIDLDHFKRINDTWSHAVGDEVLRHVAGLLAHTHGSIGDVPADGGFAARIGGEEFLVVESDRTAAEAVERIELLREAIAGHDWDVIAPGLRVTVSAGAAVAGPGDTQHTLLDRADRHLYAAKSTGRNRVVSD
jgi:two-component system cell cycle response regulator